MGEWKTSMSVRVSQDFRREFEAFAEKERRKPGTMAEIVLTWAFEQLKAAGSVERLLKFHLGKPKDKIQW
jgi:predicted transcriptional regulator